MSNIIKGNDLMLFDSTGKSYAFATSHTLSLSAETSDVSSKDHGMWSGAEVTKYTWEISSENLYTVGDYFKMFDAMIAGTPIAIKFGIKSENDPTKSVADGDYPNWTSGTTYLSGNAVITSLEANASNGENATYSVTLQGTGKLTKTQPTVTLTLTADPSSGGTVTGGGTYGTGSVVHIQATPATGYSFVKWSDGNTQASRNITVTSTTNLIAEFED